MRPEDILRFLRARPFEPFRIYMSDGKTYDVAHPELALVERSVVIVGVPGPMGPNGPLEHSVFCALVHITRAEKLNGTAAK